MMRCGRRSRALEPCICEANLGSSAYRACSICSSRCCSCSESGTFDLLCARRHMAERPTRGNGCNPTGVGCGSHPTSCISGYVAPGACDSRVATLDETRRTDRSGAEPCTGAVDGTVGLTPPVLGRVEQSLDGRLRRVDQALHPHPDQPQPCPLQAQVIEQGA